MNKISLVSRRQDKCFDTPTRASMRAHERSEKQEELKTESISKKDIPNQKDVFLSMENGAPTVEIDLPEDKQIDFEHLASEYLQGRDKALVSAEFSKEKIGDKWELKLQFTPEHPSKLLTVKELAAMLGLSTETIYLMRKKGQIKGYKAGKSWRFMWSEVLEALKA